MNLRLCVAALLLMPPAAFAQGNAGPFGGLFGRTPERIGRDYTLFEIRTSTSLQFDDQLLTASGTPEEGINAVAGVNAGAAFEHQTDRVKARVRSTGTYQEFLQTHPIGGTTVETTGSVNWRPGTRFALDGTVAHLYSPFFQFHPTLMSSPYFPGVVIPAAPYVASLVASHTLDTSVGFTSYYSKRSTLGASIARRQTRFERRPEDDFTMNGGQALWTRRLNRDFLVRLGYGREKIRLQKRADLDFIHETLEAGVDFTRALSVARRTTLAFDTQTSIIRRPGAGRQYRLNGGVSLARLFARTWLVGVHADRSTEFMPGFIEPLFNNTAGMNLMGLFSRRAELIMTANAGHGEFGTDGSRGRFTTTNATTQLNFAVTRKFGFFAQHAFYYFRLPPGASPVSSLDRILRQTLTVGATAWIPLLDRERLPSDSR